MLRVLRALLFRRMVVKIFMALGFVVGATLLFLAWKQSEAEISALETETKESARKIADSMIGSIEHTMLQGNGVVVTDLVHTVKMRVPDAELRIFDPRGEEVFGDRPPPPPSVPPDLAASIKDAQRRLRDNAEILHPIANESRCHECHNPDAKVRGVLSLRIDDTKSRAKRDDTITRLVEDAFIRVMTAKNKDLLDGYFKELTTAAPGITGVAVYDPEGDLSFGEAIPYVTPAVLETTLKPGAHRRGLEYDGGHIELIPLPMQKRCTECHDDKAPVRGAMAIAIADLPSDTGASARELEAVLDTSLRVIMMSSLGRLITGFLDTAFGTGVVGDLALYDDAGRTYYTTKHVPPPAHVAGALSTNRMTWGFMGRGIDERVRVVQPLANGEKCQRCHGDDMPVRGAVVVSLSTGHAAELRAMAKKRAIEFMGFALATILLLLYILLGYLVIRPVRAIGDVAEAVGQGKLDVTVERAAVDGDEVSRLGHRINHMIEGLRTELAMRRFVSKGTAAAARGAVAAQMRRPTTVLFTDIRGFTAYSETVSPERVVEMLNRLLQAQADVVEKHHGDIDKYVGDELMAVFEGDDAEARAVRCAVEMVEAVEKLRSADEPMRVGAGISRGEVVHGPVGSRNRQDFTVIGDVVNIGARLCSAASPGEILVSQAVIDHCGELGDIVFESLEPLPLKGKREPFPVFRALRR